VEEAPPRLRAHHRIAPQSSTAAHIKHLGTLGTGNHFIEVCLDEAQRVWIMLHSGSRGVGNRIGQHFIALAQKDMKKHIAQPPRQGPRVLSKGREHFDDYVFAVEWAQRYARTNRELMMQAILDTLQKSRDLPRSGRRRWPSTVTTTTSLEEHHYGATVLRDPQGRGARGRGRARHHPGLDGREELHRAREGQPGELPLVQPRGGARDVAQRGASGASRSRTTSRPRPRASSAARTVHT
jgi:tRNA-splicing ligase RtcB